MDGNMTFALRAVWVVSPFISTPIFERHFISVESRIKSLANYVPLPMGENFTESLLIQTGIKKSDSFIVGRDGCEQKCCAPAFELPTSSGILSPVVVLQHRGLLLCALPLIDYSEDKEKWLFLNVAQAMDCLTMLSEQLNGDISQKSVVRSQLQRFVSMSLPFGQPVCLSAVLCEQILCAGAKETTVDKIKQSVWNPTTLKGKGQLTFHISEQIHCTMPYEEGKYNTKPMISGTVWANIGEISGCNPEILLTLSHPKKLSSLTLAPRAQTTVQSDEATTIVFCATSSSRSVLCHYTTFDITLPVKGKLSVYKTGIKEQNTLHLILEPTKALLQKLEVTVSCSSTEIIKVIKSSTGTVVEEEGTIRWNLPVSKLLSRSAELEATVLMHDNQDIQCIAEVNFKLVDHTWSGCKIIPQSVTISPTSKVKSVFAAETTSGKYNIYPSSLPS